MAKTANDRLTIDQRLEKLGRQRELVHRIKKTGIICIVAMFGIAFLTLPMSLLGVSEDLIDSMIIIIAPLLFLSFILPLVGYFAGMWVGVKEKVLASRMTPHILEKVMDHLEVYDAYKALDTDYIKHADLGLPHYDHIRECQDYTKGVFRGIPLEFGEFTLEEEQTERDEDGDTKTSYVAVFSGLMVVCQHNLDLQDDFSISQYTTYIGGNAVRTESEAFNKAYSIRGNDGHSIFYLLTPHYMEKLLALSNEIGKRLAMQFRRDGKLLLCISGLDLFEVQEAGSAAELQKQIEGEMDFLGKILETLEVPTQEQLEAKRR